MKVKEESDNWEKQGDQKSDARRGGNPTQSLQGRRDALHFAVAASTRPGYWFEVYSQWALSWQRVPHGKSDVNLREIDITVPGSQKE
jgi:hypothetical protein